MIRSSLVLTVAAAKQLQDAIYASKLWQNQKMLLSKLTNHFTHNPKENSMQKSIFTHSTTRILGLVALLTLISCSLIGGYNARSLEFLTSLKASHMMFIDNFTKGEGKAFNEEKLKIAISENELKFREAIEYSTSLNDELRTKNLMILHEIFQLDAEKLQGDKALLTEKDAEVMKEPSNHAYALAIKGECVRPEAKCK